MQNMTFFDRPTAHHYLLFFLFSFKKDGDNDCCELFENFSIKILLISFSF